MVTDESRYINHDPFSGEEGDLRLRKVRMVTTRKPHQCLGWLDGGPHEIPVGSRARLETALVDGDYFGRYYACLPCMDKELAMFDGEEA